MHLNFIINCNTICEDCPSSCILHVVKLTFMKFYGYKYIPIMFLSLYRERYDLLVCAELKLHVHVMTYM